MIQKSQDELNELMRYYDLLQDKSGPELASEYNYVDSHYRKSTDVRQRLRLLMLLLLPNTGFQDTGAVLNLLENPPAQIDASPDVVAFENLLTLLLEQQQTTDLQVRNLSTKLRAAEAEIKSLQDKINAIKNIEKNLMRKNTS